MNLFAQFGHELDCDLVVGFARDEIEIRQRTNGSPLIDSELLILEISENMAHFSAAIIAKINYVNGRSNPIIKHQLTHTDQNNKLAIHLYKHVGGGLKQGIRSQYSDDIRMAIASLNTT